MSTENRRVEIETCPHCAAPHAMIVELVFRTVPSAAASRTRVQVPSVCRESGAAFLAALEVDVPAGKQLSRHSAVTLANGD